jgi:hypothetical protein
MRRPIPPPPISSSESALVLEPRASCTLALAWLGLHAVLGAALWATAVPAWAKAAGFVALVVHATAARPTAAPALVWRADGAVELEAHAYGLDAATTYTDAWVRLRLTSAAGHRREVVLARDQLDIVTWARLQARLRRQAR